MYSQFVSFLDGTPEVVPSSFATLLILEFVGWKEGTAKSASGHRCVKLGARERAGAFRETRCGTTTRASPCGLGIGLSQKAQSASFNPPKPHPTRRVESSLGFH
jgi:hypothetical protein